MSYLKKLKLQKSHPDTLPKLPKLPKGNKSENKLTPPAAKSAKRGFDSFDSTPSRLISEKESETAFNILDRLLGGGRSTTMDIWRAKCRSASAGELDMWRARLEIEASGIFDYGSQGIIRLKKNDESE